MIGVVTQLVPYVSKTQESGILDRILKLLIQREDNQLKHS